jgi:hypothetical protein
MVDRGELETRGRYAHLNFSRASIEAAQQRGQAISLTVAARIMGRSTDFVRDLIAAGELTSFSNPKWPVFQLEVERYARAHPPSSERVGQLTTEGASKLVGLSIGQVRKLAGAGLIPSDRDDRGRYWFRREHLALYLRARAAAAAAEQFSPAPEPPDTAAIDARESASIAAVAMSQAGKS